MVWSSVLRRNLSDGARIPEFLQKLKRVFRGFSGRALRAVIATCSALSLNLEGWHRQLPIPQLARSTVQVSLVSAICKVVNGDTSADFLTKVDSECVTPLQPPVDPKPRPT